MSNFMKVIYMAAVSLLMALSIHLSALADTNHQGPPDIANSNFDDTVFTGCQNSTALLNDGAAAGTSSISLSTSEWQAISTLAVEKNKDLQLSWQLRNINVLPAQYIVIYRLDPRFNIPLLFVFPYDYTQEKFTSNFHSYQNGRLLLADTTPDAPQAEEYNSYFQQALRSIPLQAGDVISIELINQLPASVQEIDGKNAYQIYSTVDNNFNTFSLNNKLISTNASVWCQQLTNSGGSTNCVADNSGYLPSSTFKTGLADNSLQEMFSTLKVCTNSSSTLCYYKQGMQMSVAIDDKEIKPLAQAFFDYSKIDPYDPSSDTITGKTALPLFQSQATEAGHLTFATPSTNTQNSVLNYIGLGRYIMRVMIGNNTMTDNKLQNIEQINLEYIIANTRPTAEAVGSNLPKDILLNQENDGTLYVRIKDRSKLGGITGSIMINHVMYSSTHMRIANLVHEDVVQPILTNYKSAALVIYDYLINMNSPIRKIAKYLLIFYVLFTGMYFTLGMVQITTQELFNRLLKITIITILFSDYSYKFFNQYLFSVVDAGLQQLINAVSVNPANQAFNPFGFIDKALDPYLNLKFSSSLWSNLASYIFPLGLGGIFIVMFILDAIITFFKVIVKLIAQYVITYISIYILISLTPIFITLMLFSYTNSIFNKWIRELFGYILYPAFNIFFVVLFILINNSISQVGSVNSQICWGNAIDPKVQNIKALAPKPLQAVVSDDELKKVLPDNTFRWVKSSPFASAIPRLLEISLILACFMRILSTITNKANEIAGSIGGSISPISVAPSLRMELPKNQGNSPQLGIMDKLKKMATVIQNGSDTPRTDKATSKASSTKTSSNTSPDKQLTKKRSTLEKQPNGSNLGKPANEKRNNLEDALAQAQSKTVKAQPLNNSKK